MTDPNPSGAPADPAADKTAPAASAETAGAPLPFGTFGTNRGSGLARGKRTVTPAASAAPANTGEYQPTALEVIVPQREYKNPFGGESAPAVEPSAKAPQSAAPVDRPAASTPAPAPAPAATPAAVRTYVAPSEAPPAKAPPIAPPPAKAPPAAAPIAQAKAELNILPPAEVKRTPVSWEKSPAPSKGTETAYPPRPPRDDRRDDRREPRRDESRRDEPRRDDRPTFRTDAQRARDSERTSAPAPAAAPKSSGFFAWLKGLFGGKKVSPASTQERRPEGEFPRDDGHRHHRRHRGGRGRHHGGPRAEGQQGGHSQSHEGQPRGEGGENRSEYNEGGHRRRRHRGGRGRHRGDPNSEGQQGGGFI